MRLPSRRLRAARAEIVPPLARDIAEAPPEVFGEDDLVAPAGGRAPTLEELAQSRLEPGRHRGRVFREATKRGKPVKVTTFGPVEPATPMVEAIDAAREG